MFEMISDLFHNVAYWGNWPDRLFTLFVQASKPIKGGKFGAMTQFKVPHPSKNEKAPPVSWVTDHLEKNGVRTFLYLHNAEYMFFSVRKTQEAMARYLYDEETFQMRSWQNPWGRSKATGQPKARSKTKRRIKQRKGTWSFVESLLK